MNNADKPAYPYKPELDSIPTGSNTYKREVEKKSVGLTKRERFAMAAMQGLLSNPEVTKHCKDFDIANRCLSVTNYILNKIEETNE